jgi:hypothetical protein
MRYLAKNQRAKQRQRHDLPALLWRPLPFFQKNRQSPIGSVYAAVARRRSVVGSQQLVVRVERRRLLTLPVESMTPNSEPEWKKKTIAARLRC